eukprot:CAMPEP_0172487352 /NCGR_PEP_ID=MMETSP1066-20121228/16401_1 /TAXON_ID=671091 /ORGANISM="Coscinodiscus wailesii, Strain CCMP2513" /LENGTH=220 /DNA_ID=CAMNT_0013253909 /DNA_START=65 /DNA_END=727 /DNA_ORIENTATION=-
MPIVKLFYYQATGRANQIRLTLAAGNIDFEDEFGTFPPSDEQRSEWRKLGGNTTTNVPMLQIGDEYYTQSSAVLRVAARQAGLMPNNDRDLYLVDKLIADADDFRTAAYKTFVTWGATREDADKFVEEVMPLHFGNLERQLKEGGGSFFVGNVLTVADITVYDAVTSFGSGRVPGGAALKNFDALREWTKRVEANPGIAKYLAGEQYAKIMKFGPGTLGL